LKKAPVCLEVGLIAAVFGERDLGGAVIEVQGRLHGAEGDFAVVAGAVGDDGWPIEGEISAIPQGRPVRCASDRSMGNSPGRSFRHRHELGKPQLVGSGGEGERLSDAVATAELRLVLPGDRLDTSECLLDALADIRPLAADHLADPMAGAAHDLLDGNATVGEPCDDSVHLPTDAMIKSSLKQQHICR